MPRRGSSKPPAEPVVKPYGCDLFLEEEDDIDSLVNNITNFNYWCASRMLTLERKYAKEMLNSIGVAQAVTDRDRAKIALRGRQYSVQNECLARDLSTDGTFPKAWQRVENGFRLLKDGDEEAVARELAASRIRRCFWVSQVLYEADFFDGVRVSASDNMTTLDYGIVSMEAFEIYAQNHDIDTEQFILHLDPHNYYMMNIVDYLVGNTDRHWGNWGVLVDNADNRPVCLHKLMDFNHAFYAYDHIEGANCQTVFGKHMTQKEAAVQAVTKIELNQLREIDKAVFAELPQYYEMFLERLKLLRNIS